MQPRTRPLQSQQQSSSRPAPATSTSPTLSQSGFVIKPLLQTSVTCLFACCSKQVDDLELERGQQARLPLPVPCDHVPSKRNSRTVAGTLHHPPGQVSVRVCEPPAPHRGRANARAGDPQSHADARAPAPRKGQTDHFASSTRGL